MRLLYDTPKAWASNKTYDNGTSTTITYSFVGTSDLYLFEDGYDEPDPKVDQVFAISTSQQAAVKLALDQFSNVADITFVEVQRQPLRLEHFGLGLQTTSKCDCDDGSSLGMGFHTWTNSRGGDIWITSLDKDETFDRGKDYNFAALMHEIGHALGLSTHLRERPVTNITRFY